MESNEYFSSYNHLRPRLLQNAKRYLYDTFLAEDLVEDTFMCGLEHLPAFRDGDLFSWLFKIMHRLYIKDYELNKKRKQLLEQMPPVDTVDRCCPPDLYMKMAKMAFALPERLIMTFVLARFWGCSAAKISEIFKIPQGTVKSRIARADEIFRKNLDSWAFIK